MVSVLIVMISGCSLALSTPDPARPAHVAPRCDTSKGLVAVDWIAAGLLATGALSLLSESEEQPAGLAALASVAFIVSAVRGNGVVNSCRETLDRYAAAPRAPVEVAEQPRRFEDPYAEPGDLPARRIVAPPRVAAPPQAPTAPSPPVAPPATKPAVTPAPAPVADEDWADFWTEIP
jgi:hypothetical protein